MEEARDKVLYIWVQGDPYRAPEVHMMAGPVMNLNKFRDRYVDTSRGYLIIRTGQVCDQPTTINQQECQGQLYGLMLTPVEGKVASSTAPSESISGMSLTAIKGIGRRYTSALHDEANIDSVQELLAAGASPKGREKIQAATGFSPKQILRWVQLADLMRIEGVGSDYSQLLWDAGVTSVPDLASQKPRALMNKLNRVKEEQRGVHRLPYQRQVTAWIEQASKLKPMVSV